MIDIFLISKKQREKFYKIVSPVGDYFARIGVHPHVLSITGFILSIFAGVIYGTGSFFWAGWIVALAGTCDALDGPIARQTEKTSIFGSFLDSTLDRFSDMFLFIGLAYYFAGGHWLSGRLIGIEGEGQSSPSPSPSSTSPPDGFIILPSRSMQTAATVVKPSARMSSLSSFIPD